MTSPTKGRPDWSNSSHAARNRLSSCGARRRALIACTFAGAASPQRYGIAISGTYLLRLGIGSRRLAQTRAGLELGALRQRQCLQTQAAAAVRDHRVGQPEFNLLAAIGDLVAVAGCATNG
jgi:hypothetical protein